MRRVAGWLALYYVVVSSLLISVALRELLYVVLHQIHKRCLLGALPAATDCLWRWHSAPRLGSLSFWLKRVTAISFVCSFAPVMLTLLSAYVSCFGWSYGLCVWSLALSLVALLAAVLLFTHLLFDCFRCCCYCWAFAVTWWNGCCLLLLFGSFLTGFLAPAAVDGVLTLHSRALWVSNAFPTDFGANLRTFLL